MEVIKNGNVRQAAGQSESQQKNYRVHRGYRRENTLGGGKAFS